MSFSFLNSTAARLVTLLLLAQAVLLFSFTRKEPVPAARPLSQFPSDVNGWSKIQDGVMDAETARVLNADDTLSRDFASPDRHSGANLFIASFLSQRNGKTPHSPKNCLPGSGWIQENTGHIQIEVPGRAEPIEVNRYVIAKGNSRAVVLYWYQSRDRVVADEYWAKYFVIRDAIRYNRTDTSLIRVTTGVGPQGVAPAEEAAIGLAKASFPYFAEFLPH
jgi:EpsI family protein